MSDSKTKKLHELICIVCGNDHSKPRDWCDRSIEEIKLDHAREQIKELETQNIQVGLILTEALSSLSKENSALKSRIEKLREALEFYASTMNWNNLLNYNNNMIGSDDLELMKKIVDGADCSEWVGGKTARAALRKIEGE